MHYFALHIGDYVTATAHLSMLEDGAYNRLLRRYYQDERPLPAAIAECQRVVGARTRQEREAVETILREFFVLRADGWHQVRADEEIAVYHRKAEIAKTNGRGGGRPKKNQTGSQREPTENPAGYLSEPTDNRSQNLTINQEPRTNSDLTRSDAGGVEPDMLKAAFDAGIRVLGKAGHSEQQARGLIGKWRKDYGEGAVLEALGRCQLSGVSEPVSYITAALKATKRTTDPPKHQGFNG